MWEKLVCKILAECSLVGQIPAGHNRILILSWINDYPSLGIKISCQHDCSLSLLSILNIRAHFKEDEWMYAAFEKYATVVSYIRLQLLALSIHPWVVMWSFLSGLFTEYHLILRSVFPFNFLKHDYMYHFCPVLTCLECSSSSSRHTLATHQKAFLASVLPVYIHLSSTIFIFEYLSSFHHGSVEYSKH